MDDEILEIDLKELGINCIYFLLQESCNRNISVNKIIEDCLKNSLKEYENDKNQLVFNFEP